MLARRLADAMDETLDLGTAFVYPAQGDDALTGASHAALAREAGDTAVISAPLAAHGQDWGVLLLERSQGAAFDPAEQELVRTLGLLLGPVLDLKRDKERNIARRAWDASVAATRALFGPRHPGWKLIGTLVLVLIVFLSIADDEHRVAAKTVVEGEVQRAAVAPFEGYIAESPQAQVALASALGRDQSWVSRAANPADVRDPTAETIALVCSRWPEGRLSADEIAAAPLLSQLYTRRMVAQDGVNQAAALLLCSVGRARALGIPRERWVFLHGMAEGAEWRLSGRAGIARCR